MKLMFSLESISANNVKHLISSTMIKTTIWNALHVTQSLINVLSVMKTPLVESVMLATGLLQLVGNADLYLRTATQSLKNISLKPFGATIYGSLILNMNVLNVLLAITGTLL